MANYNIAIPFLLEQVFGATARIPRYRRLRQLLAGEDAEQEMPTPGYAVQEVDEVDVVELSALGTPILEPVTLVIPGKDSAYMATDGTGYRLALPPATMIDFSRAKRIVETEVQGRDGSVKELIGMSDWLLRIRGVIVGDGYGYPYAYISRLRDFFEYGGVVRVEARICEELGIRDAVLMNLDLPRQEGFVNMQPFTIELTADLAVELELREDEAQQQPVIVPGTTPDQQLAAATAQATAPKTVLQTTETATQRVITYADGSVDIIPL
jgi:hypothetical protein